VSELELLGALHVELLRHGELGSAGHAHELFQASTVEALLGGAFDGDLTLAELLEHGDLGLGTLNGLDGELIVVDGETWRADLDCRLAVPDRSTLTPYAVVVPFSASAPIALRGPLVESELEARLLDVLGPPAGPVAVRIDGTFDAVRLRSVPRQERPYPPLAQAIAHQHVRDLVNVSGSLVGFCFPDALDGIELLGWHLHFASSDRRSGGHVLSCRLREAVAYVDQGTELHVELPPAVSPHQGSAVDQAALRGLESEG